MVLLSMARIVLTTPWSVAPTAWTIQLYVVPGGLRWENCAIDPGLSQNFYIKMAEFGQKSEGEKTSFTRLSNCISMW